MQFPHKFLLSLAAAGLIAGCAHDNEEDLYPEVAACDTAAVTYLSTVQPILQRSCTGCHRTASPAGGIILDNHAEVKKYADAGRLVGSIAHAAGYVPMPLGGTKLADCDIASIKKWTTDGAPNN